MQYLILIYGDEQRFAQLASDPAAQKALYAAYSAYSAEMRAAGVLRGGAELKPTHTATTVRVRQGKPITTDGPFAETKEQLGGYYLLEAKDLDEAIKIAARIPTAKTGSIELRPIMVFE